MNFCVAAAYTGLRIQGCQDPITAIERQFMDHMAEYGLSYGTPQEYEFRFNIFAAKDAEFAEINANPEHTFTVGHNKFSTWTPEELKRLLGRLPSTFNEDEVVILEETNDTAVDWRTKGAVNPVRDQGGCGSCWAFGSTAAMEAEHFIVTKSLLQLSEQQLVDCDTKSSGCNGGLESYAFSYLSSHGQELRSAYPYTGKTGTCKFAAASAKVTVKSQTAVAAKSVAQLKAAIAKQPTNVGVEADKSVFNAYKSGILNSSTCGTKLDHAVVAVGYGNASGQDYYIVRNSWGSSWGESGYIRIAAVDGAGICGIQLDSRYPTTN